MHTDRPHPDAVLCPRCGYPLESTPDTDACPECGTPAEIADPAFRIGSAWQRRPGVVSWFLTAVSLLNWNRAFDLIRLEPRSAVWLSRINHAVAAVLVAVALKIDDVKPVLLGATTARPTHALGALLIYVPAAYLGLLGLTRIERVGLRFFGNRRGGRITPPIAASVCAHASYGWIVAGLLGVAGAGAASVFFKTGYNARTAGWIAGFPPVHMYGAVIGGFLGMLVFETLAYVGAMRCRFANLPPSPDERIATGSDPSDLDPSDLDPSASGPVEPGPAVPPNDRPSTAEPTL